MKYCGKCHMVHKIGTCAYKIDPRIRSVDIKSKYSNNWDWFISSSVWRSKRLHILRRDNGLCICCKNKYNRVVAATEVHHIEKINDNNKLDDSNLISLCRACHKRIDIDSNYYDCESYIEGLEDVKVMLF